MTKESAAQALPPLDEIEAYLFDWDGNGARSLHAGHDVVARRCADFGLYPTRAQIIRHYGDWRAAIKHGLPEGLLDEYVVGVKPMFHNALVTAPLYPGFRDVLTTVHGRGKRTGIITSASRDTIAASLDYHGLAQYIDVVVAAEDVSRHKPHPDSIIAALGSLGVPSGGALMSGDAYDKDILAAQAAGTHGLLFYPPDHQEIYNYSDELLNSVPVIASWYQLLDQLQ